MLCSRSQTRSPALEPAGSECCAHRPAAAGTWGLELTVSRLPDLPAPQALSPAASVPCGALVPQCCPLLLQGIQCVPPLSAPSSVPRGDPRPPLKARPGPSSLHHQSLLTCTRQVRCLVSPPAGEDPLGRGLSAFTGPQPSPGRWSHGAGGQVLGKHLRSVRTRGLTRCLTRWLLHASGGVRAWDTRAPC